MRKRKTMSTTEDALGALEEVVKGSKPAKAPRVTPVPKGNRRPPSTPAEPTTYDSDVPVAFRSWDLGKRFHIKRFLGKGSYGSVCEALDKVTGNRVAIKRITNLFDVKENAKRIYREIRILHLLDHPNIIRIVHLHMPKRRKYNDLYIVFECMDTDFGKLTYDTTQNLTIAHVRWLLYQMLLGLKYVHSAGVIHRDLKPANVLITSSCDLKLCDFGLARSVGDTDEARSDDEGDDDDTIAPPMIHRQLTRHVVTRWYRAPELMLYNDGDYTTSIDVWSAGCVLGEMLGMLDNLDARGRKMDRSAMFPGSSCYPLSGSAASPDPSRGKTHSDQLSVIFKVLGEPDDRTIELARTEDAREYLMSLKGMEAPPLESRYPKASNEAMDLLRKMLVISPEDRISIDDAIRHPFLKPVWRADEELSRKHMINFDLIKDGDDLRQLIYREVTKYNLSDETRTCRVPYKLRPGETLQHNHYQNKKTPTPTATPDASTAGAGSGVGAGAGDAAAGAPASAESGEVPGSAKSTGSLVAKMDATELASNT